jgi:hypothetical protein
MLSDLHENGRKSRFIKALKGYPLLELKTASRGGQKGGARVYFFVNEDGEAVLLNCEVKTGDSPSAAKLTEALEIILAYRKGLQIYKENP